MIFTAAALAGALASCTYRAGDGDSPLGRSFTWFSYLNGDDLRAGCTAAAPDRYRIVYNGVWREQVRNYDFTLRSDGGGSLKAHVKGETDFARAIPLDDPLSPWRAKTVRANVKGADIRRLLRGLRRSGFYQSAPPGTRVQSWGFFWVVAACEGGQFRLNAWAYPSARFKDVRLARLLKRLDGTGIPFSPPRETWEPDRQEDKDVDRYQLVIKGSRFTNHLRIF
jgi:hypothetical protein